MPTIPPSRRPRPKPPAAQLPIPKTTPAARRGKATASEPYPESPENEHQKNVREQFTAHGWSSSIDQYGDTVTVSPEGDSMTHDTAPTATTLYEKFVSHRKESNQCPKPQPSPKPS